MILVLGGGSSGKSAFAEKKIKEIKGSRKVYYIATMKVYGPEEERIVERHRRSRAGKGFITVEQPSDISKCLEKMDKESAALLECTSNLCANEMFTKEGACSEDEVCGKVSSEIGILNDHLSELVVVSGNVFEDGVSYDEMTKSYVRALGRINKRLAEMSEEVWETVAGIPVRIK